MPTVNMILAGVLKCGQNAARYNQKKDASSFHNPVG